MRPTLIVIHKPDRFYKNNKIKLQANIPNEYKHKILKKKKSNKIYGIRKRII